MGWGPVAVASFALLAACRGSDQGAPDGVADDVSAVDGGLEMHGAARGTGKRLGIVFTANVIGELEPCG